MKEIKNDEENIDIDSIIKDYTELDLNDEEIINEDNTIYNYNLIKKIINGKFEEKVCKLKTIKDNKKITGSGFFCDIPSKQLKVLITNNHVIDQNFLDNEKKLVYSIEIEGKEINKEINLEFERYKYTNKEKDFTIIEIIDEDLIKSFFIIDYNQPFKLEENQDEEIFSLEYPKGKNLKISFGNILKLSIKSMYKDCFFAYNIGTLSGSSGSPIISFNDFRIIGLHKAGARHGQKENKINLGIYLDKVIEIIPKKKKYLENVIYLQISIFFSNPLEKIKIFDNRNYIDDKIEKIIINKKEVDKENIDNGFYKFNEEGSYFIGLYFYPDEKFSDFSYLFHDCKNLEKISLPPFIGNQIDNMEHMFDGCTLCREIKFSKNFLTKNVKNMSYMSNKCEFLKELDLSSFDTENVKNISYMFNDCLNIKKLNLSSFNTKNVEDISYMFGGCSKLNDLDISNFNTENVKNMRGMFSYCSSLTNINLKSFNTKNVENMDSLFSGCKRLKKIDLSSFITDNTTDMQYIFNCCISLDNLELKSFNTKKVVDMSCMFRNCSSLINVNIKSFNTGNVKSTSNMFEGCESLTELDLSSFDKNNLKIDVKDMFKGCSNLKGIKSNNEYIINEYREDNPKKNISHISPLFQPLSIGFGNHLSNCFYPPFF